MRSSNVHFRPFTPEIRLCAAANPCHISSVLKSRQSVDLFGTEILVGVICVHQLWCIGSCLANSGACMRFQDLVIGTIVLASPFAGSQSQQSSAPQNPTFRARTELVL